MGSNRDFIFIFSSISIILIVVLPISNFALCESSFERAKSSMELAEEALGSAYLALVRAEKAGGDVSELVAHLNTAFEYRSEAEKALKSGQYEKTIALAGKVIEASNVVLDVDISLIVVAENLAETEFYNQVLLSFGIVCSTILFGFLGWRLFKGYYVKKMSELRSEFVVDES